MMAVRFWELLTGSALFGVVLSLATLDPGVLLFSVLLLLVCCVHWKRWG